jgi:very-short-patch-repair endonuclease
VDEKGANTDARVAALAANQHGVVTYAQLRAAGIGRGDIEARARRGALHRVHRAVYAVGHPGLSVEGRYMAAVLACGEGAVLSHASAAALWNLLRPIEGPVHVSLPRHSGRRPRAGIRIHRTTLEPTDLTHRAGIPVTTPNRTILDLRRSFPPHLVRGATRQAQLARYKLDPRLAADRTRSDLELDFGAFCRRHRLPRPEVNVRVGRFTVDFLWRSQRLVVETDSYEYHHGSVAFEDDHERDLALRRRGLEVLRYTGRQLKREPALIAAEIRARLTARPAPAAPPPGNVELPR